MKRKNNIYLYMTVLLMIIYIGLLAVLCISEHMDSRATIRSFGDAFWYSLVTLTTVGYGDLLPVTPLGHAIGVVFLLMSAGIMMTCLVP
ncbi:MAG: potassium channel family protein [Eubacterium sp.]|nr:potassium channel family protein [Eubacterium sp.]